MTRFENVENIFKPSHPSYLSAYEDGTECSKTSAYKIQKSGNYPGESTQQEPFSFGKYEWKMSHNEFRV
jgi:hypothetical protein